MFTLPTTDGESSILWSHDDDGIPERLRVECHGGDRWLLVSEIQYDEWETGAVCLDGYRAEWSDLLVSLMGHANGSSEIMGIMVKGNTKIPFTEKPVKFARLSGKCGWWAAWSYVGENQSGMPALTISFKRPLSADEMVSAIGQMAKAFDWWDKHCGLRYGA